MNINDELNAINGMFVPERLHMFVNIDELNQYSDIDPIIKTDLVRYHERIHYFQTGMTGYGQLRWNMYRQASNSILSDWIEATNKYKDKRPMPIGYLLTKSKEDLYNALMIKMIGQDSLVPFELQSYVAEFPVKLEDLNLYYLKGDYELTPKIIVNSNPYYINGIDVLESHAKLLEALYALEVYAIPLDITLNKENIPKKYYYIWEWFSEMFGQESTLDFLTICDLALQTGKWQIPLRTEDWHDQHPGWRFYNLSIALSKKPVELFSSKRDMIQRYDIYCSTLLSECNLESLNDVFNNCLSTYESYELLGLEKRMLAMLKFRMDHRWVGAYPHLDLSTWKEMNEQFHPLLMQESDNLKIVPSGDDIIPDDPTHAEGIISESILELHLQALTNQIIGNISKYSTNLDEIQCGYKYFGFNNACFYQSNGHCNGSFQPKNGSPVSWKMINQIDMSGCTFEAFIEITGIGMSSNIDLNFISRKIPNLEELTRIMKEMK